MKTAIITGSSGAIGIEVLKTFVENGYYVTAQYNKNRASIDALILQLEKEGIKDRINVVQADFLDISQVERLYNEHIKVFKTVDVLINNAGVDFYSLAQDVCCEDYDRVVNINERAPIMLSALVLKNMIEQKFGKVLFVSSIWGASGGSFESLYSASKSSLIGYTKALAKEVGPSNINVNCICPGVIESPMNEGYSQEEMQDIIDRTPISRIGKPQDVAELLLFLASERASFITGQTITIDGGFTL